MLATILFTDLVGSTAKAAELGDRGWRDLLAEHHARVRRELARHRGVELDTAGDWECEVLDGKVAGIAVSIGARVPGEARPGEVLVSQTVKDLVAGSGLAFEERGAAELKGIPGEWRLYAAVLA